MSKTKAFDRVSECKRLSLEDHVNLLCNDVCSIFILFAELFCDEKNGVKQKQKARRQGPNATKNKSLLGTGFLSFESLRNPPSCSIPETHSLTETLPNKTLQGGLIK